MRKKITVIAQDPTLFSGTLRYNLDPFKEHSASAIEALLLRAGLSDVLNKEPELSKEAGDDKKEDDKEVYSEAATTVVPLSE